MIQVSLTKIKTQDGITLDGIYIKPRRRSIDALILVHGLGSRFYSGQDTIRELSRLTEKNNIGFFKFNTRGHDTINRDGAGRRPNQGEAFEKFTDCRKDIKAVIKQAKNLGYKNIFLVGHSTGSNKILYYMYKTRNRAVKSLVLTGAVSDMAMWKIEDPKKMRKAIGLAKKLIKKNPDSLLPQKYGIYSAQRYLSLYEAGHAEDVFPYHNPKGSWKELRSIRVPVAVIIGSKDKYLDRPAKELIREFAKYSHRAKLFYGNIIKGANHGFHKKERELARDIINWINRIK